MQYQTFTLSNGLTVLSIPQAGALSVTAMVFSHVGSRNETKRIGGIAHFVEHLAFKGTDKYPTTLKLSKALDSVGADYNAFTSKDYTGYWVKVDARHTDLALDILSEMTFAPLYVESEIEREKGVIIEEMHMYEDTPMYMTEEYFEEQLFGASHPLGRQIIGTKQSVMSITRDDIVKFHDTYYTPSNLVLVIAGAVPADIEVRVQKACATKIKARKIPTAKKVTALPPKQAIVVKSKKTEQIHLVMGMPVSLRYGHTDALKAKIADIVFGGSMSSRLFINIRERQGLGYYIRSGLGLYEDAGHWTVSAGVDATRLDMALQLIKKEWLRLEKGITKQEFKQAKEYYKGKLALKLEDTASVAGWYAKQHMFEKNIKNPEDILAEVDALSYEAVNAWLKKSVKANKLRLLVVGPFEEKKQFEKFV